MVYTDHDPAKPDQLRRASHEAGVSTQALHGSLQLNRTISSALGAGPFSGGTIDRFDAFLVSLDTALVNARGSHEQLTDALQRVAGPIEDEQRTKRIRAERREALNDAEEALAEGRQRLEAARSDLSRAREALSAKRQAIAYAEAANASRVATGGSPAPIDTSGLREAERQVERAEREVRHQERLVSREAHQVDAARDNLDRARRAHERAEDARDAAVRAFTQLLTLAGVLPPLVLPPTTSTPADCPTGDEHVNNILKGIEDGTGTANNLALPPFEGLKSLLGGTTGGILASELAKQLGVCPPTVVEPPTPPDPPDDDGGGSLFDVVMDAPGVVKDAVTDAPGVAWDGLAKGNQLIDDGLRELDEALQDIPPPEEAPFFSPPGPIRGLP